MYKDGQRSAGWEFGSWESGDLGREGLPIPHRAQICVVPGLNSSPHLSLSNMLPLSDKLPLPRPLPPLATPFYPSNTPPSLKPFHSSGSKNLPTLTSSLKPLRRRVLTTKSRAVPPGGAISSGCSLTSRSSGGNRSLISASDVVEDERHAGLALGVDSHIRFKAKAVDDRHQAAHAV